MSLPTPNTRKEQYLNAIATGNSGGLPTPITREEEYLDAIAKSGGGSGEGDMKKSVYDSDLAVANAGGIKAFVSNAVSGKVDKVEGKGLSTNDYSDTEKGKVADNTAAIEAIENVTGACNLAPVGTTQTIRNRTFTVNSDGSVTVSGSGDGNSAECWVELSLKPGTYKMSGTPLTDPATFAMVILANNSQWVVSDVGRGVEFTITNENITHYLLVVTAAADLTTPKTFYPMIYDARLNPTGYVPYAMTNRELTNLFEFSAVTTTTDGSGNATLFSGYFHIVANANTRILTPFWANGYTYVKVEDLNGNIKANTEVTIYYCKINHAYA